MKKNILSFIIVFVVILSIVFFNIYSKNQQHEGYSNYNLGSASGNYPISESTVLLEKSYPRIRRIPELSNDTSSKVWWHYPTFEVGSYDQITNNIRYSNNPDIARCSPMDVCGALYKEYQKKSNYSKVLPPVNSSCGVRVNYYTTPFNLLDFKSGNDNILY
jgi:hypothetical protein